MSRIKAFFRKAIRSIISILTWPFRMTWRGMKAVGRFFKRCGIAIYRSPVATYRKVIYFRDKLLKTVNYLQEESAKWSMAFKIVSTPYKILIYFGLSPRLAAGFLVAGSAVGSGVIVDTVIQEKSFSNRDAGVYHAPLPNPVEWSESYNTLNVSLNATPVQEISITDSSINSFTGSTLPSGETSVIYIGGKPTAENFTATWLIAGEVIFENNRCKTLTLSDISAHTLEIIGNSSDGQSISPVAGGAASHPMRAIGGGMFMANDLSVSGGLYDRVVVDSATSAIDGQVNKLVIKNLWTRSGSCLISRLKVGKLSIIRNTIGHDSNLATKEFTVESSVTAANMDISDNIEINVTEPALQ